MKTLPLPSLHPTAKSNQLRANIPASLGQGGIDHILLKSGIQLLMFDWQINQSILFQGGLNDQSIGFGFCLDGRYGHHPACFNRPLTIKAGESGFFSYPRGVEILERTYRKRMHRINLLLDGEHLSTLISGDEDRFYPILRSLEKKAPTRIGNILTPVMSTALYQLHHCPYRGTTRQIFLDGKCMELIAHMMEQICYSSGCSYDCTVKRSDNEGVHHAAHLLVRNLNNPPDIMRSPISRIEQDQLFRSFARRSGSLLEYLRSHRLQMAMQLLQDGEVNVTQAALMVGYTNLSYFAKAFKSTFGMAPSKLRKSFRIT